MVRVHSSVESIIVFEGTLDQLLFFLQFLFRMPPCL